MDIVDELECLHWRHDMNSTRDQMGRFAVLIGIVLLLGAFIVGRTADAQNTPPQGAKAVKWEYTDGANLNVTQMNALGQDGWELCTFVSYGKDLYYVFKRPRN
jgi:hypothetical protein